MRKILKGFTLIELLIVIAIIGILTVAFLPNALNAPKRAKDAGRLKLVQDIKAAVEGYYYSHNNTLPTIDGEITDADAAKISITLPPNRSSDEKYFLCGNSSNTFYAVGAKVLTGASANSSAVDTDFSEANCATASFQGKVGGTIMYVGTSTPGL